MFSLYGIKITEKDLQESQSTIQVVIIKTGFTLIFVTGELAV